MEEVTWCFHVRRGVGPGGGCGQALPTPWHGLHKGDRDPKTQALVATPSF